jgi:DNA-binding SARP family transcriptional activator
VLGPVAVEYEGRPVALGTPQSRALLSLLLVRRGEVVSTEWIIDGLWGATPPPSARAQVQNRVCRLRSVICADPGGTRGVDLCGASPGHDLGVGPTGAPAGALALQTVGAGYRLCVPPGLLDVDVFRSLVDSAETYLRQGFVGQAAAVLREALGSWRDRPYADVDQPVVQEAANHLAVLRLVATERWVAAELTGGTGWAVLPELTRLVAEHPYHERLRAHYMTALCMSGRAAEALAVYRDGRHRLAQDLGVEPSAELQTLHREILGGRQLNGNPAVSAGKARSANLDVIAIDQMRNRSSIRREISS